MQQPDFSKSAGNQSGQIRGTSFAEIRAQMYESIRNRHQYDDGYEEDFPDDDDADCYCE